MDSALDVKILLTVNETTKEEFNLIVNSNQDIDTILWEVRLALRERLHKND